jgi:hypothetical protein
LSLHLLMEAYLQYIGDAHRAAWRTNDVANSTVKLILAPLLGRHPTIIEGFQPFFPKLALFSSCHIKTSTFIFHDYLMGK